MTNWLPAKSWRDITYADDREPEHKYAERFSL
jgi:hypothetical protein